MSELRPSLSGLATAALILLTTAATAMQLSAHDVMLEFCTDDFQGRRLAAGDREQVETLFIGAGASTRPYRQVVIVKDFAISRPDVSGNRADLLVEYVTLWTLDVETVRLSGVPGIKTRHDFRLEKTVTIDGGVRGGAAKNGSQPWRIAGDPPVPHIGVAAAVRFVNDLRAHASEAVIRKNADATLLALKRLQ